MASDKTGARSFRRVVRILSTVMALIFFLAYVPRFIFPISNNAPDLLPDQEWERKVMDAMVLTFLLGYAVGWWRILWGGIIIILSALVVTLPFIVIRGTYASLMFGIPLFLIGLLYLFVYSLEKRENAESR